MEQPEPPSSVTLPPGTPVVQLSVFLENRVGALLSIVRTINDCHVDVVGLSVVDSMDVTIVRLILTDPDAVGTVFIERGIPFSETRLTVVQLDEGAHGLSDCLTALLQGETNIHFSYPLLSRPNGKAALALCLEDNEFGISVLRRSGFTLLSQEDLSR
ncbi:MAG: acetolactate synthase [Verrucomicrobia bacterium]|nr:acetolactate synthase [Verrucomicrobiota bacterium]